MEAKITMKKRVISILAVMTICITLVGCFNYREINKITFATSIIFNTDEQDNVILYLDCVTPYRNASESSDKGRRIMFKGKGKTALEAIRDINVSSSNNLNFSQVRAYIFTEEAAKKGVENYVDLINNDQQFGFKPYMYVYFGDIDNLLDMTNNDEEYLGLYLNNLLEKNIRNGKVIRANVNDYITHTLMGNNIGFMSAIEIKDDEVGSKIALNGGAIMRDNHMIARLEEKDALTFNILTKNIREGTFEVANPNELDKFITLDILEETNKTDIEIRDEDVILKKDINIKVSIGEIQGDLIVDKESLDKIKMDEEWKIGKYEEDFFNEYKEKGIDVLGVKTLMNQRFPDENTDKILDRTILETNINLIIDGSSLVKNSL